LKNIPHVSILKGLWIIVTYHFILLYISWNHVSVLKRLWTIIAYHLFLLYVSWNSIDVLRRWNHHFIFISELKRHSACTYVREALDNYHITSHPIPSSSTTWNSETTITLTISGY